MNAAVTKQTGLKAGEDLWQFALRIQEALSLDASTRQRARDTVATTSENPGLSEADLYLEWFNDLLCDGRERQKALSSPDLHYLSWLAGRVKNPFHISFRDHQGLMRRFGSPETANQLVNVVWKQEIAWAHRLRLSKDDKTAILANIFLLAATQNPSRELSRLAEMRETVMSEMDYALAPEHECPPAQIRSDPHIGGRFTPLFLRRYRVAAQSKIVQMTPEQLLHLAETVRHKEKKARRFLAAERAIIICRRSPLCRLTGVIAAAAEAGYDSDALVAGEATFLDKLSSGEETIEPNTGTPYVEFIAWLRRNPPVQPQNIGSFTSQTALNAAIVNPSRFIDTLPEGYRDLGAGVRDVFAAWIAPYLAGDVAPIDLVCDYGFHLVGESFRKLPRLDFQFD